MRWVFRCERCGDIFFPLFSVLLLNKQSFTQRTNNYYTTTEFQHFSNATSFLAFFPLLLLLTLTTQQPHFLDQHVHLLFKYFEPLPPNPILINLNPLRAFFLLNPDYPHQSWPTNSPFRGLFHLLPSLLLGSAFLKKKTMRTCGVLKPVYPLHFCLDGTYSSATHSFE